MPFYGVTAEPDIDALADADSWAVYDASGSAIAEATMTQLRAYTNSIVNTTATTLTVTAALHNGKTITVNSAAPIAITLPQATGTGNKYRFWIGVAATATGHTIKVANATDIMAGVAWMLTTSTDNAIGFKTTATSDTITLNGTTLGGVVGDTIEIIDCKTGVFGVMSYAAPTGTYATPFSATV
jgi:hypothetical protein